MALVNIEEDHIPSLDGKVSIITGGASGIGWAATQLLSEKNAVVHVLDLHKPKEDLKNVHFHSCDVTRWEALRLIFDRIGQIDYAFANAGITETSDFFADHQDNEGNLLEPKYEVFDVNIRAVFNFVKLAWSTMRKKNTSGSIVITTSAVAYSPEHSLPVYSSSKLTVIGLIRSLRSALPQQGITINGVAPSMTSTTLLPKNLEGQMRAQGLPISDARVVARALVYSAIAKQKRRVEAYGREKEAEKWVEERWNGRIIMTLGEQYAELEEPIADLRPFWFGLENFELARLQQAATDFRHLAVNKGSPVV
ncbi:short chain dehydrogenase reductase [Aspergillus californicus]